MKSEPLLRIRDQGFLGRHCYSENPWHVLRFALPMAIFFLWLGCSSVRSVGATLGWAAGGVVFWTLFEYFYHRYFFHWNPRHPTLRRFVHASHIAHHLDPNDLQSLNAGPVFALPLAALLYGILRLVLRDPSEAALLMAGNSVGYFLYELAHYTAHAGTGMSGWAGALRRYHRLHHHADWSSRYGVTTPLWDQVFRTQGRALQRAPDRELSSLRRGLPST